MSVDSLTLLAPLSGVIVPLARVPDPVFSARLAGDGLSIEPLSNRLLAPCDARVVQVHRAGHALSLEASGLELVIHVGLDTVGLAGEGFTPLVTALDEVRAGDPLLTFDPDLVASRARSLLTQVLVTNMDRVARIEPAAGRVSAGRDVLMRVYLANGARPSDATAGPGDDTGETAIESGPIPVVADSGLHARPAAMLAAAARRFAADVRIVKDGREANARSVVSIMALEAQEGDRVTLVARGADAAEAIHVLSAMLATSVSTSVNEPPASATARPPATTTPVADAPDDRVLRGVAASGGVAIGRVTPLRPDDAVVHEKRAADPAHERRALDAAIATAHQQLEALRTRLAAGSDADRAGIFAAHEELLEDPELIDAATMSIGSGASAAWAWRQAYDAQTERLLALRSPLLSARAADLRDVGRRVLHLLVGQDGAPRELPPDSIVVAEDLAPSEVASLDRARVRGFCTSAGSATSHVAILARGLGIPAVTGIDPRALDLAPGTRVLLDGDAGTLRVAPTAPEEAVVAERQAADAHRRGAELAAAALPATTRDGHRVSVVANIGSAADARRVIEMGGEGVGLLRSEFVFMDRSTAPDEDDQARIYEEIARTLGPERLVVIRTLDVGGDKPLPYLSVGAEANPFLGERGIRLTLARPRIFRTQIRAVLRASAAGRVAIMFPMVSMLAEWRAARAMVEAERAALGVPPIPVGIMVETAAAAMMADRFAREADFLSIGTNDLTQYTLAMDRTHPALASRVDALDPSVLRLIERTVAGAHASGRWVAVCGALAGDLAAVPVLIGLGVDELSVDVPVIAAVRSRVRSLSHEEARATAREALDADDGPAVRALVARRHD